MVTEFQPFIGKYRSNEIIFGDILSFHQIDSGVSGCLSDLTVGLSRLKATPLSLTGCTNISSIKLTVHISASGYCLSFHSSWNCVPFIYWLFSPHLWTLLLLIIIYENNGTHKRNPIKMFFNGKTVCISHYTPFYSISSPFITITLYNCSNSNLLNYIFITKLRNKGIYLIQFHRVLFFLLKSCDQIIYRYCVFSSFDQL